MSKDQVEHSAATHCYADRKRLANVLNGMRRQLIREMWFPSDGRKKDIGTVTACVEGVNRFFDDTIDKLWKN